NVEREGTVVIDDHSAVAIEKAAARGEEGFGLDVVLLGFEAVEFGVLDLEAPEARDEEEEDGDGAILESGDAAGDEAGVIAQGRLIGKLVRSFEMAQVGRNDHGEIRWSFLSYSKRSGRKLLGN